MKRYLLLVAAVVALLALSACAKSPNAGPASAPPVAPEATVSPTAAIGPAGGATFEKFSKIAIGMTYEQVVQIMGNEGSKRSAPSPTVDDKGPTKPTPPGTVVYAWTSSTPGNTNVMHVTFVKNRVTAKDQAGLP